MSRPVTRNPGSKLGQPLLSNLAQVGLLDRHNFFVVMVTGLIFLFPANIFAGAAAEESAGTEARPSAEH